VGKVTNPNVEVVRQLFERYATTGVESGLEVIHEDVVIEIPADLSAEPDVYRGHDGVRRYFAGFEGMMEDVRFDLIDVTPVGDRVIASAWFGGRGASSGVDVGLDAFIVFAFADGKVVRMDPYPDMDSARAAVE
jgi:ketosteroid isomerase-like protein